MYNNHGAYDPSLRLQSADSLSSKVRIHGPRRGIHVNQNRLCTKVPNRIAGSNKGQVRTQHTIPRTNSQRTQSEMNGRRPAADCMNFLHFQISGQFLFKLNNLRAHRGDIPAVKGLGNHLVFKVSNLRGTQEDIKAFEVWYRIFRNGLLQQ